MRHRDQSICQRRQRAGSRARMALVWAAVTGTVLRLALGPASASTEVEGQRENVKLRTENASIREVLDALSATFKLTYKLAPNVLRNLTGLYSGTLNQVLARVLDGNDFVVEISGDGVNIVVIGTSGMSGRNSPGPAIAAASAILPAGDAAAPTGPASKPALPASKPTLQAASPSLPSSKPVPPLTSYLSTNGLGYPDSTP